MTTQIHPTAIVDPGAAIGQGVQMGPGVIVEGDTRIGDGCRLMASAIIRRHTTMGQANEVHPFAVLGGEPQDLKHDPEVRSFLRIGSGNVFREGVTVHRGTGEDAVTAVGDNNYIMSGAHIAHNVRIGSNCVLVNGCALGGYVELQDNSILSAHVLVHQFCRLGELVMVRGNSTPSMHVPPYCMVVERGRIAALNRVGLRRAAHISDEDREQIDQAFKLLYRSGLRTSNALVEMDRHAEWGPAADKFRQFVRQVLQAEPPYNRGLCPFLGRRSR